MEFLADFWAVEDSIITPDLIVDLCLKYLREDFLPRQIDNSQAYGYRSRMAFAAIQAMGDVVLHDEHPVLRRIVDAWQGIIKWIKSLFRMRITPEIPELPDLDRCFTVHYLTRFWFRLFACPSLAPLTVFGPEASEMFYQLWRESGDASKLLGTASYGMAVFAGFMLHLREHPSDRHDILHHAGDFDVLADFVLRQITLALPNNDSATAEASWSDMSNAAIIIIQSSTYKSLVQAMVRQRGVSVITLVLLRASEAFSELGNPRTIALIIHRSIIYLGNAFMQIDGFRLFSKSVRRGFLEAIYNCSEKLSVTLRQKELVSLEPIMETTTKFLAYRSVIEDVMCTLEHLPMNEEEEQHSRVEGNPIKWWWDTFRRLANKNNQILIVYKKRMAERRADMVCGNSQVGPVFCGQRRREAILKDCLRQCQKLGSKESDMRCCSGCKAAYYCSKVR